VIVASISCIYGPGIPAEYLKAAIPQKNGNGINARFCEISVQYSRNDLEIGRGRFRVQLEITLTSFCEMIDAIRC